jgi:hypothetical protein
MPNLTQDQALQIAKVFAGFAKTVEDYRFTHFSALTELQQSSLRNIEATLRATSNDFLDKGINLALDDVQFALDKLGEITDTINHDLKTLADVNKALQVVGVLMQLGTAFATGNPAGIVSALGSAVKDLQAAAPADSTAKP